MNALSKFSFISNFNKEKFSKIEANNNGLSSQDIKRIDKDNDGTVSVEEILNDKDACSKLLAKINSIAAEKANIVNAIKSVQGQKVDAENDEKSAEKKPDQAKRRPDGFQSFLKQPPKFGDYNSFNVAA